MSETIDEKDPLLMLLTEALRAGPGSPQWHEAVSKVRAGQAETDEYKLLLTAREHLESGKKYRAVRAGPNFTRKLLDQLDVPSSMKSRLPTATLLAIGAGVALLALLVSIGVWLMPSGRPDAPAADDLDKLLFVTPVTSVNFEAGDAPGSQWKQVGPLPLKSEGVLGPSIDRAAPKDYIGGALVSTWPIRADQPVSFEVSLSYLRPSPDLIVQVFVTDTFDFSENRAISSNEFVWLLQEGTARVVLPGGRVDGASQRINPSPRPFNVRLAVNNRFATIDAGEKRLFAGPHGLGSGDRCLGVRFLRKGGDKNEIVSVQSMRVMKP